MTSLPSVQVAQCLPSLHCKQFLTLPFHGYKKLQFVQPRKWIKNQSLISMGYVTHVGTLRFLLMNARKDLVNRWKAIPSKSPWHCDPDSSQIGT